MVSRYLVVLILLVLGSYCFQQLHDEYQLMAFYEKNSLKPVLHTYYNKHFKNSTRFVEFEQTLEELYNNHQDYLDILLTDCDQDVEKKINACSRMSKTKDNRQITGTIPSSQFRKINTLLIQSPPTTQTLDHKSDIYSYEDLRKFMLNLLPNFYQQLHNVEQYEDFLLPRYSAKLIVFVKEDQEIPSVMREVAIWAYLRVDVGVVVDLTEDVLGKFEVKGFPSFVVVKYNFNTSQHEYHYYQDSELTEQNYEKIKQFVDKFALKQPRNDLLFHKITMETDSEIVTIETEGELEQYKQRASGWVIIAHSEGKPPQKLLDLQKKYSTYFSYINYPTFPANKFFLYNPTESYTFPLLSQTNLQFNSLTFQDFKSNMTLWLSKDMVILGATEQYAHICGVAEKVLFRGHVRCLVIGADGEQELRKFMGIQFQVGFVVRVQGGKDGDRDGNRETKGVKFTSDEYSQVYRELDYATRMKIKQQLDNYLQRPVSQVRQDSTLSQACFHPLKKCLLLLTNLGKQDRTFQQYLKQLAFDYMNSFILYEVDIDSNPQLIKQIGGIKDKKADIIIYNPRAHQYTRLNKKVTKNLILQFLKANLKDDKRLKKENGEALAEVVVRRRKNKEEKGKEGKEEGNQEL